MVRPYFRINSILVFFNGFQTLRLIQGMCPQLASIFIMQEGLVVYGGGGSVQIVSEGFRGVKAGTPYVSGSHGFPKRCQSIVWPFPI